MSRWKSVVTAATVLGEALLTIVRAVRTPPRRDPPPERDYAGTVRDQRARMDAAARRRPPEDA